MHPKKPYSPECVEEEFCELRLYRILGSSLPQATSKIRQNGSFRGYAGLPQEALCLRWKRLMMKESAT